MFYTSSVSLKNGLPNLLIQDGRSSFWNYEVFKTENKNKTLSWKGDEVGTVREVVDMYDQ